MASWLPFPLPSSIQKRFLSYALSKVGIFDEASLDLDNLNLTWGRQNIVELKDVALDAAAISKKAALPPNLQIKAGKVSSLRLMVPADIYKSGIVIDAVGVRISLNYQEDTGHGIRQRRSSTHGQSPAHRKTARRIASPTRQRVRAYRYSDTDVLPSAQDLAQSFFREEPLEDRQRLEASVAAHTATLDESVMSESSQGTEPGTGATIGVPAFLANFLTGVLDRVVVNVQDVCVVIDAQLPGSASPTANLAFQLTVSNAKVWSAASLAASDVTEGHQLRHVQVDGITLDMLTDKERTSPAPQSLASSSSDGSRAVQTGNATRTMRKESIRSSSSFLDEAAMESPLLPDRVSLQSSIHTLDADRFADANDDVPFAQPADSEFDIRLGDDNISWGSRQDRQGPGTQDLWDSTADENDLPDSLLFDERRATQAVSYLPQPSELLDRSTPRLLPQAVENHMSSRLGPPSVYSEQSYETTPGPGSWPTRDHARSDLSRQSPQESVLSLASAVENIESTPSDAHHALSPRQSQELPSVVDESDLAQSRIFSHAEVESMYMSAMTQDMHTSTVPNTMPGAWQTEVHEDNDSASKLVPSTRNVDRPSEVETPRAQSPMKKKPSQRGDDFNDKRVATSLVVIDEIKLAIRSNEDTREHHPTQSQDLRSGVDVTGTSFVHRNRTISRQESSLSTMSDNVDTVGISSSEVFAKSWLEVAVQSSAVRCRIDLATIQVLVRAGTAMNSIRSKSAVKASPSPTQAGLDVNIELQVQDISLDVIEDLAVLDASTTSIVSVRLSKMLFHHKMDDSRLQLSAFQLSLGDVQVLRFDVEHDTAEKGIHKPDLDIAYNNARSDVRNRAVPELSVSGLMLLLDLDLPALSRVSDHIGGLSGILEMGSMLSDHSLPPSPTSRKRSTSGVRFTDDTTPDLSATSVKVNARLAGVIVSLQGQSCELSLRTSSLKAIQRDQGISLSTAKIDIAQVLPQGSSIRNAIAVENIRLDLLNTPTDKDLEKFLALLTPSNDKYDNDGDILIETLIRQRKKGACLRVQLDALRTTIEDYASLTVLPTLSADLAQLSAVTKYLPEDDRPGMLSMIRVKDCEAQLPTNPLFGNVRLSFQEIQCAHVGLPALLAVAASNLLVTTSQGLELVHQLLPYQGADNLPMVMIRTFGDEIEPEVKVKLFNISLEYSVATLLGLSGTATGQEDNNAATELIHAAADLALSTYTSQTPTTNMPQTTSSNEKKTRIDLSIKSSAVGLTPLHLTSKALFVLTDSSLSILVPPAQATQVSVKLKRAALFIIDDVAHEEESQATPRRTITNTTTEARVADALSRRGYVSVASIMSARIDVSIEDAMPGRESTVEVDIRNELMLMETCADSTQTLIATLSALSPPSPPSKQPKYRLEPFTLEDMISSFTGQAVEATALSPQKLFDFDDETGSEAIPAVQTSQMDDLLDDDLLLESELTSSLYGPVSGLLTDPVETQEEDSRFEAEAAESLLEEDPFVMTVTPDDLPFSDNTLIKDLRQQSRKRTGGPPVVLRPEETDDLDFFALGPDAHVLGDVRRFNGPVPARSAHKPQAAHCPVRVRLRDVHFIWNLHDGYDWQRTRVGISSAVEQIEQRTEERMAKRRQSRSAVDDEESVIGDLLFNSIYIGVPSTQEAQDIRRQINRHIDDLASETESVPLSGMSRPPAYSTSNRSSNRPRRRLKLERGRSHKVAFELKGLSVDFLLFPPDSSELQSSIDVRVQSLEIFDNVPTSTWRKFLTLLKEDGGREMSKPMVHLELDNVKTIQNYAATEMVVKVTLLPLRLHVDQDALDFITRFFEFKDDSKPKSSEPVDPPFLQRVEVNTVDLQLDYKPKKIDYVGLRSGHTTEFMNFIVLDAANIRLKHAIVYGIKGFEPLHKTLNDVWMPDVRRNQLPTVLAGLAPVRSLVNIGTGVRDVVAIPVREYKKDGRIVRSISKGAFQFGKTTASELARLGAKVAIGTQTILSGAEELLAPSSASPAVRSSPSRRISSDHGWHDADEENGDREKRAISAYADQPLGVLAGLQSARRYLEHDLLTAKDALIAVQGEVLNSNSPGAAAVAVARHAPTVILRPVIGASRAFGTALLGVGNQIDRDNLRRMEDKYKRH